MKTCFVVSPIGEEGSDEREVADAVLEELIRPALEHEDLGYVVQRADDERAPGLITEQIIEQLLNADLVVADLSNLNPNVLYELAVRHATGRPLVQIMQRGQRLPFDIADYRTIWFNRTRLSGRSQTVQELREAARAAATRESVANPLSRAINLQSLRKEGSGFEQRVMMMLDLMRDELRVAKEPLQQFNEEERRRRGAVAHAYGIFLALSDIVRARASALGVKHSLGWRHKPGTDFGVVQLSKNREVVAEYQIAVDDTTPKVRPSVILEKLDRALRDLASADAETANDA